MDRGPEVGATLGAQEQRPLRRARQHARPLGRPVGCQAHGFLVSRYILAEGRCGGRDDGSLGRRRAPSVGATRRAGWVQLHPGPSTPAPGLGADLAAAARAVHQDELAGALSVARALEAGEAPVRPGLGDGDTAAKHHAPQPRAAPLRGECPRTTGQVPSHGCFGRQGPGDHLWLSSPPAAAGKGILAR